MSSNTKHIAPSKANFVPLIERPGSPHATPPGLLRRVAPQLHAANARNRQMAPEPATPLPGTISPLDLRSLAGRGPESLLAAVQEAWTSRLEYESPLKEWETDQR